MTDIKIKLGDKEYKLKITLGFWKNLTFPRKDISSIYENYGRLVECIELAIYYGNKHDNNWSLPVHARNDIQGLIEEIDTQEGMDEMHEAFSKACIKFMPKEKEEKGEGQGDTKKK